ncbi:hypothetical protein Cflav_PD2044 [Pedosphaera parvula Ellin514]|uniref:Uncharacterized protein n=1 Tax=Pedosphaera parvula (strain Ellin514) TaxID=320771 RepID=B9XMF3_PEDPL|nr:hypothetical protein Cflav_PD2044 [Pedosphaera parvula Ellin514]
MSSRQTILSITTACSRSREPSGCTISKNIALPPVGVIGPWGVEGSGLYKSTSLQAIHAGEL